MDMLVASQQLVWDRVPAIAVALAEKCADTAQRARAAIADLPTDGFLALWYNDDLDKLLLNVGDWIEPDDLDQYRTALRPLASLFDYEHEMGKPGGSDGEGTWVKLAERPMVARAFLEKRSVSPTLDFMSRGLGYKPGVIPTAPNPLVAGLTSGLLGAGLGYGAGWLGETLLPDRWKKGRLSRTLAILGGLGGLAGPAVWAANNVSMGKPWYSGDSMANARYSDTVESHMPWRFNPETMETYDNPHYPSQPSLHTLPELERYAGKQGQEQFIADMEKQSFLSQTGMNRKWPEISVPDFHASVNLDPRVRERLTPATRAAATGLVTGASALSGGTKLVSPLAVGRMAAGMGSGYLSGALVGSVLGSLTGMPASTQERLKNTGMWAGALANILPLAFGG